MGNLGSVFGQISIALINNATRLDMELKEVSPTFLMASTAVSILALSLFRSCYKSVRRSLTHENFRDKLLCIPFIRAKFENKMQKELESFQKQIQQTISVFGPLLLEIPEEGWSIDQIQNLIHKYAKTTEEELKDNQFSGMLYSNGNHSQFDESAIELHYSYKKDLRSRSEDVKKLQTEAFHSTQHWNILHDAFKAPIHIERQVICMLAKTFGGEPDQVMGTVTAGGTDSLREICRIMAGFGASKRIPRGEGIILKTKMAHVGVDKGIHDYGLKSVIVECDEMGRMCVIHLKECLKKYGNKVLMIFTSAPNYPWGTIDPIKDIAEIAKEYNVCMHVDACLGAFYINYFDSFEANQILKYPGVTSVSADFHKFAMSAKGHSALVTKSYQGCNLMFHGIYAFPDWSGGVYATKGPLGSEPCKALNVLITLLGFGNGRYREIAIKLHDAAVTMAKIISSNFKGKLKLILDPETNIVAFTIDKEMGLPEGAAYTLYVLMANKHFVFNKLNNDSLHFCVTARFLEDDSLLTKFKDALTESLAELEAICEKCIKEETNLPGFAGAYSTIKKTENVSLKKFSFTDYFFGSLGIETTIKNFVVANLYPHLDIKKLDCTKDSL